MFAMPRAPCSAPTLAGVSLRVLAEQLRAQLGQVDRQGDSVHANVCRNLHRGSRAMVRAQNKSKCESNCSQMSHPSTQGPGICLELGWVTCQHGIFFLLLENNVI